MVGAATDYGYPQQAPHGAAAVFPLLGYALPEALQVEVEPQWPSEPSGSPRDREFHADTLFADRAVVPPVVEPMMSPPFARAPAFAEAPVFAEPPITIPRLPPESSPYSPFTLPPWLEPSSNDVAIPAVPSVAPLHEAFPAPKPLPPVPTGDHAEPFAPPSWLGPPPGQGPAPPPHVPAIPPSFSPFDDGEQTIRHAPPAGGPGGAQSGSFPSWLEPLPPAIPPAGLAPPGHENVSFPSNVGSAPYSAPDPAPPPNPPAPPATGGGWLERAMVNPPPLEPTPPGSWVNPAFSTPATAPVFVEPAAPEPPMFREPAPLPPMSSARGPARKPLADMFRALGAKPTSPHAGPDEDRI